MPNAIELSGVNKSFGSKRAVVGLDLAIAEGSLIGLIGPNGAGKTTTIRMIMSIIFPDSGDIRVLGKTSAVESKDRIGYLPEERGLYKKMKVGPFLKYMARLKGIDDRGLDVKVKSWLQRLDLADCYRKKCQELSKGMQQKVQFIASIIHEPDLVILDEPFSGLDPVNSRMLRTLIDEQHDAGRTIIFSTHQMSQAEALCDRVVMIHEGRKVLDNTPAEIRSRFDPRAVAFEAESFEEAVLSPVTEIERIERQNSHVVAHLRENASASAAIPRIASLVPVSRIEVVRPSLEDVFIEIVSAASPGHQNREQLAASLRAGTRPRSDSGGD